jgi:hypothetical protein
MTTTLFQAMVETGRRLHAMVEGAATAGNANALDFTDTNLLLQQAFAADTFKGGTAFIITSAGLAQGQSRIISAQDTAIKFTLSAAFSAAIAAGDFYGVMTSRYSRGLLVSKINEALGEIGDVPTLDTSLTTLTDTLEYALPVAAKRDLREVWLARNTAAPYDWERISLYRTEWAAAAATGKLLFPYQPRVGYLIKLAYLAPHTSVTADASNLPSDYVSVDWLAWEAALRCASYRKEQPGADDKQLIGLIQVLAARADQARRHRRVGEWPSSVINRLPYTGG